MASAEHDHGGPAGDDGGSRDHRGPLDADVRVLASAPELLLCAALVATGRADGSGACLIFDAGDRHGLAATDPAAETSVELEFSLWEGPGPDVIGTRLPVVVGDLKDEGRRWPQLVERSRQSPIRSSAVLPLMVDDVGVGLLTAHRYSVDPFSVDDLSDLMILSRAMGVLAAVHLRSEPNGLPPTTISQAVGMVMERWGVAAEDAMAVIRARALSLEVTVPALAAALVHGATDLGEPPVR